MCVGMNCDGSPLTTYVSAAAAGDQPTIRVHSPDSSGVISAHWAPWKPLPNAAPIIFNVVMVPAGAKHACPSCRCL